MNILIWFLFIGINVWMGYFHAFLRRKEIALGRHNKLKHGWWGLLYVSVCSIPLLWDKSWNGWYLVVSLIALHGSVFPVYRNGFADLPPFHLAKHVGKGKGSITDRILLWMGFTDALVFNVLSFLVSLLLLILSL